MSDQSARSTEWGTRQRLVHVETIMGTPISIHVIVDRNPTSAVIADVDRAAATAFALLRTVDRIFTTFDSRSDICRIARGELAVEEADPWVGEVAEACVQALSDTRGQFDAWWKGWFDPTGLVKGWGIEAAARASLRPLLDLPEVCAAGVNGGGDMQLMTDPQSDWEWRVGIADPSHPGAIMARLALRDAAVATSGTYERGPHIIDPGTGEPATTVVSATVVADSLKCADLWATTAVVAGFEDLAWIADAPTISGLLVAPDGRVRRWVGHQEI